MPRADWTISRYDAILAAIPLAFLVAALLGTVEVLPFRRALLGASAVGVAALVDALFVHPPRGA